MTEIETTVLIVGGGPIGLLGAQLLGQRKIRTLLVEKHLSRLEAPKAHALNPRSLEIAAAAGLPMDAIHAVATPAHEGRYVRMIQRLDKPEIGSLVYERQDDEVRDLTPWPLINIEQPKFEEIVEAAALTQPTVDLRRGLEWQGCLQLGDSVVSTLLDRASGEQIKVKSRYLIAADGAGSPVRDAVGIAMDGPERLAANMMIHFEADLRAHVGDQAAILYFLFGPDAGGVLIAYDVGKTWVLMHPCGMDDPPEAFDEAQCRAAIRIAVGHEPADLKVKGVRAWNMSAQVARRYRDGNVFLVGDAGHRFPPTGGLGLNTGVGDIDNLAWKIAAIEAGWASPDLLESYNAERRKIAETNMGQSLGNAMRMITLFGALGYGPDQTVDAETFAARLSEPEARAAVDAAIAFQKDHFDSLRLQLGFAYGDALRADDLLPISEFTPKAVVGARLPHLALSDGRSTLDLVSHNGFTLIAGPEADPTGLEATGLTVPLKVLIEGRDFGATKGWASHMGLSPSGALLVRPDGHILSVLPSDAETAGALAAMEAYLGQSLRAHAPVA